MGRSYTDLTIKLLFGGAQSCAYPGCGHSLILRERGRLTPVVQIAHIRSEKPGGPRHDPLYEGDINGFENLLLLCGVHHPAVDGHESVYPVEELEEWKEAQNTQEGQQLTSEDIALIRRLSTRESGPEIDDVVSLEVVGEVPVFDLGADFLRTWLEQRGREALASLETWERRRAAPSEGFDASTLPEVDAVVAESRADARTLEEGAALDARERAGETLTAEEVRYVTELRTIGERVRRTYVSLAFTTTDPDPRSPAEYRAQVEAHLADCREKFVREAHGLLASAPPLRFRLVNGSKHYVEGVQVVVTVAKDETVVALPADAPPVAAFPDPPRAYGPRRRNLLPSPVPEWVTRGGATWSPRDLGALAYRFPDPRVPEIDEQDGDVEIAFSPVSVRAFDTVDLEPVTIAARTPAPRSLTLRWRATGTNLPGRASGSIDVDTASPPSASLAERLLPTESPEVEA